MIKKSIEKLLEKGREETEERLKGYLSVCIEYM